MDKITRTLSEIQSVYGQYFSTDQLLAFVAYRRAKPPLFETLPWRVVGDGFVVGLADCDLICFAPDLDSITYQATKNHELGHLLCGHVPQLSFGKDTPDRIGFLTQLGQFCSEQQSMLMYRLEHSTADYEAELLGRLLTRYVHDGTPLPFYDVFFQ